MFTGIFPAVITPFKGNAIDEAAFRDHVEWLITEGVHGLVPCGTTGEAGALTLEEYARVVRFTVAQARGRVPVIAGAGANITEKATQLTTLCTECKADGLLHVTPYYNKPTQEGLAQHFQAVAAATPLPIILYNVPGRTGVNLLPPTVARLAGINNIVGLKDASGSLTQATEHRAAVSDTFALLSGEDALNYPLYAIGYQGAISVTANVAPRRVAELWNAWQRGDTATAARLHQALYALNQALFIESNPIPVKTALALMGRCEEAWRLPLTPMAPANRDRLAAVLRTAQLLAP
ncbi:MAG: 4-hydroxy-tetrahydrodipicolinate synthase [Deltaproteobacteria bacterium]|nr:4-hydroxy-tetrahydrodipicolinate synthase [Deltaproteobacteria bacterium]